MLVWQGNQQINIPDQSYVANDLNNITPDTDIPASEFYMPIVVPAGNNQRRIGLVAASVLRQPRLDLAAQVGVISQIQSDMSAVVAQLAAKKAVMVLPSVTVTAAELVSLIVTTKSYTKACSGVKTTDILLIQSSSFPAGYGLVSYGCTVNDQVNLTLQVPILSSGGSAITFTVTAFR